MQPHPLNLAVQQACVLAAQVLRVHPSALVTDLDGTLSPIAPTPEEASVLPGCRHALHSLRDRLGLVAVLSGRPAGEARRLLNLEGVVYLGNHGLDPWAGGKGPASPPVEQVNAASRGLRLALRDLREALAGQPGLRFEDKGATFSIHYRLAPDPESARSLVLAAASRAAARHGLTVGEGKSVVELMPPYWAGKGACLEELVRSHGLRGLVYLGDDFPDLHAFETVARLRQRDGLLTLSVGVAGQESPPDLNEKADVTLAGPEEVAAFLQDLAETLD
jgi:trehalose 6-phosphate phosphatase